VLGNTCLDETIRVGWDFREENLLTEGKNPSGKKSKKAFSPLISILSETKRDLLKKNVASKGKASRLDGTRVGEEKAGARGEGISFLQRSSVFVATSERKN